jgi:hypothetical protein
MENSGSVTCGGVSGRSTPLCSASASAITLSTKASTSLAGVPANHVVLQRAQRTMRPAEPTDVGSIM